MSDSNSVLTRVPAEVWRRILLEVMHVPYLLDTTCTGSLFELWNAMDSPKAHWNRSEWQRKLLRRVCKSWKHFAETKAYRSIEFQDCVEEPHVLAHARRAQLCQFLKHMFTEPTLWEVVEIYSDDLVDEFLVSIVQGYHPRLRRFSLRTNLSRVFAACESAAFHQLTFLHLQLFSEPPLTTTVIQTTMPQIEVLIWENAVGGPTPSDIFRLPTLHHFGWADEHGRFPLSTLLSYASTLRSLSIRNEYWFRDTLVLPDLNEFPHLEELSTNVSFEIEGPKQVPPTYPLHTIYMNYLRSIAIQGVMQILDCNPVKLRRIQSAELEWGNGGEPENLRYREDKDKIIQLADLCQERGIRLEDYKGRVRSEMPPAVGLGDIAFLCV